MSSPFWNFVAANAGGWLLALLVAWVLTARDIVPVWAALLLAALWVIKDLATFPFMRRYYESESAEQRMVGKLGVAETPLAPTGWVRVHGELWRARPVDGVPLADRTAIVVRGIEGLELVVEQVSATP